MTSCAFIEHRFLRDGFWTSLAHQEPLLYVFLVLVADRNGLSYYSFDKICTVLRISVDEDIVAPNHLIKKEVISFGRWRRNLVTGPIDLNEHFQTHIAK